MAASKSKLVGFVLLMQDDNNNQTAFYTSDVTEFQITETGIDRLSSSVETYIRSGNMQVSHLTQTIRSVIQPPSPFLLTDAPKQPMTEEEIKAIIEHLFGDDVSIYGSAIEIFTHGDLDGYEVLRRVIEYARSTPGKAQS